MSNVAERSKCVRRETLPESNARRMSFVISRRAVSLHVICYFEKDCFSAVVRAVSGLRRTDEIMFSEIGKQLL